MVCVDVYSKCDFHVHSFYSSISKSGDKDFVKNSTIERIDTLISKLIENNINMVALTDHNYFDKQLYETLKKQEKEGNCINKVLPGIEIDLLIEGVSVHVICLFDDTSEDHTQKIEEGFEIKTQYTVDDLGAVLRKIGLSVVLIAHQKCDYKSSHQNKTSLSGIGQEQFYKFINCEFFDALEIQNARVEGILKSRFLEDSINNVSCFIIGSDCHDWSFYPAHHEGAIPVEFRYIKALPTFQGLVMAITDSSRIYQYPNTKSENVLNSIKIKANNEECCIPLSQNINVIIGDNSIGKSTLLKILSNTAPKGAIDFFKKHNVEVLTEPLEQNFFTFNEQGQIRIMFDTVEKLSIKEQFKDNFKFLKIECYEEKVKTILNYYREIWDFNGKKQSSLQSLNKKLRVPCFIRSDKHYFQVVDDLNIPENKLLPVIQAFLNIIDSFKELNPHTALLNKDDIKELQKLQKEIKTIATKYQKITKHIEADILMRKVFSSVTQTFNEEITKKSNSDEQLLTSYINEYKVAIKNILNCLAFHFSPINNVFDSFISFKIPPSTNNVGKYCFIDKVLNPIEITRDIIDGLIKSEIKAEKELELLTTAEVIASIRTKKTADKSSRNVSEFLDYILDQFKDKYLKTTVEIKKDNEILEESNSAGVNALNYIDILSYTYDKPVYIIDQPEDDVSQSRISTELIPSIKNLSKRTQVIIITHNPQLVVNLDADNVIVLQKINDKITFTSGALEYFNSNFSILDLVAKTLDGGTAVIKKRWKRYEL